MALPKYIAAGTFLLTLCLFLQDREQEILSLKAQLSEFQQPVVVTVGGSAAGPTSWDSETAAAAEPVRSAAYSNASWANDWNTSVVPSRDRNMAKQRVASEAGSALQPAEASISRYLLGKLNGIVNFGHNALQSDNDYLVC